MLARILEAMGRRSSRRRIRPTCARRSAAKQQIWIELERQTPEADALLQYLELHPLTIEDIYASGAQPKIDDFPNYLYVIVHGIGSAKRKKLELVEVDIMIGDRLAGHARPDGAGHRRYRHRARSLAAHAREGRRVARARVLDRVVDRYLPVIDELDTEIERLENDVIEKAGTPRGQARARRASSRSSARCRSCGGSASTSARSC